jgi:hypothetical protein
MLTKFSGLARTLYILLAIIAAFVSLGTLNVTFVLFVLGLVAGLPLVAKEDLIWRAVSVLVLPIIATVLATIQAIGEQLSALAGNLQIGLAGAVATAIARQLYQLAADGVTGLVASNKK